MTRHRSSPIPAPEALILSLLPKSTIVNLRQVSHHQQALVDIFRKIAIDVFEPDLFSDLKLTFPLTNVSARSLSALHSLAVRCRQLRVTFPTPQEPSTTQPKLVTRKALPTPRIAALPSFPHLTTLHIVCPTSPTTTFTTLLSFKFALHPSKFPNLTHITITNLTLPGLLALRFGPFSSFGHSSPDTKVVWTKLKRLGVKMVPWWQDYKHLQPLSKYNVDPIPRMESRQAEDEYRTGIKVLHDWLYNFATTGNLTKFTFAWAGTVEGLNPMLLDHVAARTEKKWFAAGPVVWKMRSGSQGVGEGLREVWLRGIKVMREDVAVMRERNPGLEMLMVESVCASEKLVRMGKKYVVQGREWVRVDFAEEREGWWRLRWWEDPVLQELSCGYLRMAGAVVIPCRTPRKDLEDFEGGCERDGSCKILSPHLS